jgi:hypothetical protein
MSISWALMSDKNNAAVISASPISSSPLNSLTLNLITWIKKPKISATGTKYRYVGIESIDQEVWLIMKSGFNKSGTTGIVFFFKINRMKIAPMKIGMPILSKPKYQNPSVVRLNVIRYGKLKKNLNFFCVIYTPMYKWYFLNLFWYFPYWQATFYYFRPDSV